jgi:hypothetical protein
MGLPTPKEADVLSACLAWLRLHRLFCWRNNNAGILRTDRRTGKTFHKFSGEAGSSDILGVLPGGRFFACECKRPGGKLSLLQAEFLDHVRKEGGLALCVSSVTELERALTLEGVFE